MDTSTPCQRTALYDLHVSLDAKMVPFAGYEMPVQYSLGIIKEHLHTRRAAGLFDISHMGQILLEGNSDIRKDAEKIMPGDFLNLSPGQMRYSFLLNDQGGIIDDLMVTRPLDPAEQNQLFTIVNASGRTGDFEHIKKYLPHIQATLLDDRSLLALQGPSASLVMGRYCDAPEKLSFMRAGKFTIDGIGTCWISRSGYTGEDGFEISVPSNTVEKFVRTLLSQSEVLPVGLGARDSLRLEAGLPLYGHELSSEISPVEAGLVWTISPRRRTEGDFVGAAKVDRHLTLGVTQKRVGIRPLGRALAREQTEIQNDQGRKIGVVTSGGFGPSVDGPICMGYVETPYSTLDSTVYLLVRGSALPAKIVSLPFVKHRYRKG